MTFSKEDSVNLIVAKFLDLLKNGLFDEDFIKEYSIPPIDEKLVKQYLANWKKDILIHNPADKDNVEKNMWLTIEFFINHKKPKNKKKIKYYFDTYIL